MMKFKKTVPIHELLYILTQSHTLCDTIQMHLLIVLILCHVQVLVMLSTMITMIIVVIKLDLNQKRTRQHFEFVDVKANEFSLRKTIFFFLYFN